MDNDQNSRYFTIAEIRKLITLLEESNLHDLCIRRGEHKLKLAKAPSGAQTQAVTVPAHTPQSQPQTQTPQAQDATDAQKPEGVAVNSPMVGTFYRAPSPSTPSFVELGHEVEEGQVLCIVEAMKMMNQIKAPASGRITHIAVENGSPVEYGQDLFYIS